MIIGIFTGYKINLEDSRVYRAVTEDDTTLEPHPCTATQLSHAIYRNL